MRPTDRAVSPSRTALRLAAGVLGSMVLHAAMIVVVTVYGELPSIEGEFRVPSEIEFGVVDAVDTEPAAQEATPPPEAPAPEVAPTTADSEAIAPDAGRPRRDAGIHDAGVPTDGDAGESDAEVEAGSGAEAGIAEADAGPSPRLARATEGASRQVAGGQLTLRIAFARVRGTSLEPVAAQFLASIRDFQAVLGGSGIEPVRDLDQFLMSSPDPTNRSRYAFLGRSTHDRAWARERVATLAAASGRPAEWTTRFGYESAPWQDADDVGRIVLLLDDQHFLLCREQDAPRVLAWLASVAENADRPVSEGPALALGVADDEVVSFEGMNLTAYAVGEVAQYTPASARVSIVADASHHFDLALRATYDDRDTAANGSAYWDDLRQRAAQAPVARMFGMATVLDGLSPTQDHNQVRAQTELDSAQVQAILGLLQMQIAQMYARWDHRRGAQPPMPP